MRGNELVMLHGHVGSDPELRYTPSGRAVCNFSFAINKNYTNADGEKIERTKWFRCAAWGKQAEFVSQYVTKGRELLVTGDIDTHAYQGQDGQPRASLDLTVRSLTLCGKRPEAAAEPDAEESEDL